MCDKLVYDLAQEVEGAPSVFVRKDWINILDNQNQSYVSNQSVLDTSQLSNSNKWMSYREAYFSVPLLISMQTTQSPTRINNAAITSPTFATGGGIFRPATATSSSDMAVGLKNWYGNIIHSFTLDYNGSTIIQQTPFVNMWNSFKLMTSLSYQDILTQGATIGFFPDDAEAFEYYGTSGQNGTITSSRIMTPALTAGPIQQIPGSGTCNNTNQNVVVLGLPSAFQHFRSGHGNQGMAERQKWIAFDTLGQAGTYASASCYGQLLAGGTGAAIEDSGTTALKALWKAYIIKKANQVLVDDATRTQTTPGCIQYAVVATIYLKHIHSFFNMIPLLKGVFMKMTMNLNNCSSTVLAGSSVLAEAAGATLTSTEFTLCSSVNSALGGSNMLMVASNYDNQGGANLNNIVGVVATAGAAVPNEVATGYYQTYRINLSVGATCLDSTITNTPNNQCTVSGLSKSIYLYIPAYTFNPTFEQAYLSSPVKQIKYTDIYQYQILNVEGTTGTINNLLTNGIANVKSVLVLPYYSSSNAAGSSITTPPVHGGISLSPNSGFLAGQPVWASPFDPAGCGATSPLCHLTNFNIQVSGQNAIYNLQKYGFEQFNNQLYGQNAVNGGLTDGITSSLINRQNFDLEYCYYYVNIERMLPVEQSVPKSIQLIGTNMSSKAVDLICFIEYGVEVSVDALTGSRV